MIRFIRSCYIFILYTVFIYLYTLFLPKDTLTQEIFTSLFIFSPIILLHFFYMKKRGSLHFFATRYEGLEELCYNIYLQDIKRSFILVIGMFFITLCIFFIYNFRCDLMNVVLVFLNIFIIFGFIDFGNIIDLIFSHKIKWKLFFTVYVIFSFMLYGFISKVSILCFFNITDTYHKIGLQSSFLNYTSIVIYYIISMVIIDYFIRKKRKNLL